MTIVSKPSNEKYRKGFDEVFGKPKFIVFEGIDCSGKSVVSKEVTGILKFRHEHEPTFDSNFADSINFKDLNPYQREYYFLKDRMEHQSVLNDRYNICMDRYFLSGLAYAQVFSPEVIDMATSIYTMENEFRRPDITIFIDAMPKTAIEINEQRKGSAQYNKKLTVEILTQLREAYIKFIQMLSIRYNINTIIVPNTYSGVPSLVRECMKEIKNFYGDKLYIC